jgi:hypothetical protein
VGLLFVAGCGGASADVKLATSSAYDTSYDTVWDATVAALRDQYPVVKVLDKNAHRIVSCWRPIDRPDETRNALPGSGWRLYRVTVEISQQQPFRVAVSGRAAEYSPPVIRPYKDGDGADPGWRDGRTARVEADIYAKLKAYAKPAVESTPPASNPDADETYSDTCVMHPELIAVNVKGMQGYFIGEQETK